LAKNKKPVNKNRLFQVLFLLFYKVKTSISEKYRHPLICSFKITKNCNLRCTHCPFWRQPAVPVPGNETPENLRIGTLPENTCRPAGNSFEQHNTIPADRLPAVYENLSFARIRALLEKLKNDGVKIIIFEGGEPLLWMDGSRKKGISDVIEYAKRLFFITGITTNGTLNLNRINPDIFFVSIDGLEKTHNRLRGRSFGKIIENITSARNKKIIANICISKENKDEIPDLVKFLNNKVFGTTVQFFYPYEGLPDLALSAEEKTGVINRLLELKRQGYKILNSASSLVKMKNNSWKCHDFLVANVESDGSFSCGCYLKNKIKEISCSDCGFAVHCEISLAYMLNWQSINAAKNIFW